MDQSVGKELAGCSHPKSHRQWLDAQVETNDRWFPSGVYIGTGIIEVWGLKHKTVMDLLEEVYRRATKVICSISLVKKG